jgi:SAM-dependent methyltransferase
VTKHQQPELPPAKDGDLPDSVPVDIHIEIVPDAPLTTHALEEEAVFLTPTPPLGIPAASERSGGISIEGGDFATPLPAPRKRRTTQPRGLPTLASLEAARVSPAAAADPASAPSNGASPESESIYLEPTPPPEPITPAPKVDGAADFSSQETPRPSLLATPLTMPLAPPPTTAVAPSEAEVVAVDAGAIPARPMSDGDSGGNITPLAQTLAHMAEAARLHDSGADAAESADDEVELVDAPVLSVPVAPAGPRTSRPPPPPVVATPPPIPQSRTKLSPELLSALPVPEALSQRPRRPKRSKPWFEEVFDEDYLRTLPFIGVTQTAREVAFIEGSLEPSPGAELLDVACGHGRHAIELAQKGYKVTGLDLSLPLLIRAADDAQRRAVSVNFVHADMREIAFERQFDAATCMLTSFGYFDEDTNLRVAEGIARALKPGGRFLLDVVNRDYVVGDLPTRIWWEGAGCVVLEEVDFNFQTSRLVSRRSVVFDDGRQLEQEISIRAYGLHELGRLLRQAGFRVLDVSGSTATRSQFFGSASRSLMILSEKRTEDR